MVLDRLVDAGFSVTVLTRSRGSANGIPPGVEVVEVDYLSTDSLVRALRNQDAVVNTVTTEAVHGQKLVIDASIQAGVKRYIPSDWGALSTDPTVKELPVYAPMSDIQDYVAEKARLGQLEFTIFSTGAFLETVISMPFAFDFANRTAEVYDNGKHPFSTTSLASIGRAVAGGLRNAEATKNRVVYIHDLVVTQAQLVALAKKYSPPGEKWTETAVDSEAEFQKILSVIHSRGADFQTFVALLKAALFSGKFAAKYKHVDNELLGLGYFTEEDLDAKFAAKFT